MIRLRLLAMVIAGSALATFAAAQPSAPEGGDGRFTFNRAEDGGYLRLDGRTGQVSLCNRRATGWQCQVVPDERVALEAEIARLQGDNAALKKELLSRNLALPNGMRPEDASPKSRVQRPQFPDDAELNRIMTALEKVWRRLVEMIVSVQRDLQKRI
jgi:hypothetical protein